VANLLETATQAGSFKTLLKAVEVAELTETLNAEGPFTLLAPTDEVFDNLPEGALDALLQNTSKLKRVLSYHVLFGDVRSEDLLQTDEAPTLEGSVVGVDSGNGLRVNDVRVTQTDILSDNGVIHVIDGVLSPALLEAETA